ncbi:MAG: glycosyltransferase family A protein [Balneolaceae bacterium]|nr:glycosyltransferase family A protein [Balneolaceae bacterium]MDR9409749.1 glycosyltransferase family A protein [Balneolaceae bacterium]
MQESEISVIIVVKNGEKYLSDAIESVLNQTYLPSEILVVDGDSADRTAEIAQSFEEVTYIKQENEGLAAARNTGINNAGGEWIAFLDHDDIWVPNKLEMQVKRLQEESDLQYCYGLVQLFVEEGVQLRNGFDESHFKEQLKGRTPGTLIARKTLFDEIGGFDKSFSIACDVDWFTRAADSKIESAFLKKTLLHKRVHTSNLSSKVETNRREIFRVIKNSINRQQNTAHKNQ